MTVAPADEPYAAISTPIEDKQDLGHEPVHPVLTNPDQPVFPAPVGVSRQDLDDAGVGHAYMPGHVPAAVSQTPVADASGDAGGDGE